ncbi:MAG: hypothetical protein MUF38_20285 [Anaerolineae bacterium]|jgi:hypothetical protein|nr:hypothetical protein [Anaerolineae bacterium]
MAKDQQKPIYVLMRLADEWDVVRWTEYPPLAPHENGKQLVSTAAGDVELRVSPVAECNNQLLGWAHQRVEQLHPHPDSLSPECMTDVALLRETLHMSLEYIALAEDGRGHNARSRYIARQLREIQQYTAQRRDLTPISIKETNDD